MYSSNDLMIHSYANCDATKWKCIFSLSTKHSSIFVHHMCHSVTPYSLSITVAVASMPHGHMTYRRRCRCRLHAVHIAYQIRELSLSHNLIERVVGHSSKTALYYKALFIWLLLRVYFRYHQMMPMTTNCGDNKNDYSYNVTWPPPLPSQLSSMSMSVNVQYHFVRHAWTLARACPFISL